MGTSTLFYKKPFVVLFFLLLTILLKLDALSLFSTHIIGGIKGDIGIYLFIARVIPLQGLFSPGWFDLPAMYPYGKVLAWSDNFLFPTGVMFFFQKLHLNFVQSFNVTILLCSFLNGIFSYGASRVYKNSTLASLWVGVAIESSAFLALHLGHPQLQVFFFVPMLLCALEKRCFFKKGINAALILLLAFLSGIYIAFFCFLVALIWYLFYVRTFTAKENGKFLLGGFLGSIIGVPFAYPYWEVSRAFGGRDLSEGYEFAATGWSYLSAPLLSSWYGFTASFSHPEAQFFIGIAGLIAVIAGFFIAGRKGVLLGFLIGLIILSSYVPWVSILLPLGVLFADKKQNKFLIFSFLFFLSLSLGCVKGSPTLFSLVSDIITPLSSLRATGRFGLVAVFFALLVSGKAVSKFPRVATIILIFCACAEQRLSAIPLEPYYYPTLGKQSSDNSHIKKGVVVLPFTEALLKDGTIGSWQRFAEIQLEALNQFYAPEYYLVNGYSGLQGRITQPLARSLSAFPELVAIQAIKKIIGVNTVIADSGIVSPFLSAQGAAGAKERYQLGEVSFQDDIILLAPPWAEFAELSMRASSRCSVLFEQGGEVLLKEEVSEEKKSVMISLHPISPEVGVRRISLKREGCQEIWIGDTQVSGKGISVR